MKKILIFLIVLEFLLREMPYKMIVKLYQSWVDEITTDLNLDPVLVFAIIKQESGGHPIALGTTGDFGLMQITEPALIDYNTKHKSNHTLLDVWLNSKLNIQVGSWYLSWLLIQFSGDIELAISAYNQGIGNVRKNNYTLNYFNLVNTHIQNLREFVK